MIQTVFFFILRYEYMYDNNCIVINPQKYCILQQHIQLCVTLSHLSFFKFVRWAWTNLVLAQRTIWEKFKWCQNSVQFKLISFQLERKLGSTSLCSIFSTKSFQFSQGIGMVPKQHDSSRIIVNFVATERGLYFDPILVLISFKQKLQNKTKPKRFQEFVTALTIVYYSVCFTCFKCKILTFTLCVCVYMQYQYILCTIKLQNIDS
eukprot:TRINITY_DN16907_c0_g1_i3.p2 TRINITY_DN16907_c0_g1~~TRINITY_DN16907_c0_g1_i3.p2  ORF type:complete len:206 (-),score=-16.27 TRINITY_DN16907_c0_g1_i3:1133-1750(-)